MQDLSPRRLVVVTSLPDAAANPGAVVRLSSDNHPYYSDGSTWIDLTDTAAGAAQPGETWVEANDPVIVAWYGITHANNQFVAVGTATNQVATSMDGLTWVSSVAAPAANDWRDVAYGKGLYVAVASTGSGNRVMTSPDGLVWTARSCPDSTWYGVAYGNGVFVAVASSGANQAMTSPDGITWTAQTCPAQSWADVTFGNGLFVAVATSGTGFRVMTSPDGATWTLRATPADNSWFAVEYGAGRFVAMAYDGTDRAMVSDDGYTWTAATPPAYGYNDIAYGAGLFAAVAPSGCATSPDGVNWTTRTLPKANAFRAVAYGNGVFAAVAGSGVSGRIVVSGSPDVSEAPVSAVAGTDKQVQYNRAGAPAGAANVEVDAGDLVIVVNSTPTSPAADRAKLIAAKLAGRVLPSWLSSTNMHAEMQPSLWRNKAAIWMPPGSSTTLPCVFGTNGPTAQGTVTTRSVATTNLLTRTRRIAYVSASATGSLAGHYLGAGQYTTGNGSGLGGFFYSCRFAFTDGTSLATVRAFVGLSSQTTAATNVEPNTLTNSVGVAELSSDHTQLYLVYGGSAAQTAIALGTNFPPMSAAGADNGILYELTLFAPAGLDGVVYYRVERIGTTYVADGTLTPTVVGTQTPASTTLLIHRAWRCNNASAAACAIDMIGFYVEQDQ